MPKVNGVRQQPAPQQTTVRKSPPPKSNPAPRRTSPSPRRSSGRVDRKA